MFSFSLRLHCLPGVVLSEWIDVLKWKIYLLLILSALIPQNINFTYWQCPFLFLTWPLNKRTRRHCLFSWVRSTFLIHLCQNASAKISLSLLGRLFQLSHTIWSLCQFTKVCSSSLWWDVRVESAFFRKLIFT